MDPQTTGEKQGSVSWTTAWEMPWQSGGCPLTGKQKEREGEEESKGHLLDQCVSTREREKTGQAVEVFFIHTHQK